MIEIKNNNITYNAELKGEIEKLISELNTLKNKHNDILSQVKENKNQIDEIIKQLEEKQNNFNLASNFASISHPTNKTTKINNEDLQKLQEDLENLRHFIESKIMEIEIKLDILFNTSSNIENNNNINNDNKNISNNNTGDIKKSFNTIQAQFQTNIPSKLDISALAHIMKKVEDLDRNHWDLDRSFKRLLSSFNLNDILEDIAKLKDVKADKCDIPDQDSFNHLFDNINKNHKKLENQIEEINKRLDNIYTSILNKDNNNEDINGQFNQEMLQGFVIKDDFDNHLKDNEDEFYKVKKDINKIKENLSYAMNAIKKKAEEKELNNLKNNIVEKMEELVKACNLKFADKNECMKNFKHIEEQLKKILYLLKKRNEHNFEGDANNWLLAKKPINGYSCASCESYLGDLSNDIKKYIPWNRLPVKEQSDNLYRMGNGYSKMLQMINFDNNGNLNINQDLNNEEYNTLMSSDSNMINNNINMIGKTFYIKQKNMPSKTPVKIRIESAFNELKDEKIENNINGNNNIENNNMNSANNDEENKIYQYNNNSSNN